jgi:hypothetical protein
MTLNNSVSRRLRSDSVVSPWAHWLVKGRRVPKYDGRLELTWTNKHLRLLAHDDGGYEWLDPSDYRVAEVRLRHDISMMGQVEKNRTADNLARRAGCLKAKERERFTALRPEKRARSPEERA